MIPLLVTAGILGLIVGSFLNVVILRYGTGMPISRGRSVCPACGKTLAWYELIPLFSFLFLGGKCSACKSKISWQYPLIELLTGILFILVVSRQYALYPLYAGFAHGLLFSILFTLYYFCIVSILLVIAAYDFRHKVIPDAFVWSFIVLSLLKLALYFLCFKISPLSYPSILDLSAPILLFIPFWLLWKVSGGRWIGYADGTLAFGIGALLGFIGGVNAIILGFWIGAAICIILMLMEKIFPRLAHLNWKSEVPLAPFLIAGVLVVLFSLPFSQADILHLGSILHLYA